MLMSSERTIKISGKGFEALWIESHLSRAAFAEKIGLKERRIAILVKPGVHSIFRDTLNQIAAGLRINPEHLLSKLAVTSADEEAVTNHRTQSDDLDHQWLGHSLYDVHMRLLGITDPLQKQLGKNSKEVRQLQESIGSVDKLRASLDNRLAESVTQEVWDRDLLCHVYYPGSKWAEIRAKLLAKEVLESIPAMDENLLREIADAINQKTAKQIPDPPDHAARVSKAAGNRHAATKALEDRANHKSSKRA